MRIWLLQVGEVLPLKPAARRMRSGLLAEELGRRGHEVVWWVSGFDHFSKQWVLPAGSRSSELENVCFEVLHGLGYQRNVSIRRLRDHLALAESFARRSVQLPPPDLVVSNLPEHNLAYEAARFAERRDIPFVCDLRDLWPDFFVDAMPHAWLRPIARLALARDFRRARHVLRNANVLVTMMPGFLDWAYQVAGRVPDPRDRVFMLGAPRLERTDTPSPAVADAIARAHGKFTVLFVGSFSRRSYPKYLLAAARLLADVAPHIHFVIAGDGDYRAAIDAEFAGLPNLSFTGWVGEGDICHLVEAADVGVVTANELLDALPNKVFTYLAGGLPLLNAIGGGAAALVDRAGCGVNVRYDDAGQHADTLRELAADRGWTAVLTAAAQRVFEAECDADQIYRDYADLVERAASIVGRAQSI